MDDARSVESPATTVFEFAGLLCLLSLPFWILGVLVSSPAHLPLRLPASALMVVCPAVGALLLSRRRTGGWRWTSCPVGTSRATGPVWGVAVLAMPVCLALSWGVARLARPDLPTELPGPTRLAAWSGLFLLGAVAEEVGWTSYLTARVYPSWGVWRTGVTVGSIWGAWHIVPFLQAGRGAGWIVGHVAASIFMRVLMVGLFAADGGRLRTSVVFHTMVNLSIASFPVHGSDYRPAVTAPVMALITVATVTAFERKGRLTPARTGPLRRPDECGEDRPGRAEPARGWRAVGMSRRYRHRPR